MKKLLLLSALLISIFGYSQHFTSDSRAFVKVKTKRNSDIKLKVKEIIRDRDELCLADHILMVSSETKFDIDLTLLEANNEFRKYSGNDNGISCGVTYFTFSNPKILFLNYGEWGILYFLND